MLNGGFYFEWLVGWLDVGCQIMGLVGCWEVGWLECWLSMFCVVPWLVSSLLFVLLLVPCRLVGRLECCCVIDRSVGWLWLHC